MHFFIKHFLIIAADGSRAPPVYLIADSTMKKDDCDWYQCPGLSSVNSNVAHIVFCQTRVPGSKFYEELHSRVIIPFIKSQKEAAAWTPDRSVSPAASEPCIFTLDGEKAQITIYEQADMLEELKKENVVVGKPPASTTSITQPCDHGSCFKASKAALKKIHDKDVEDEVTKMKYLTAIFNCHVAKYSSKAVVEEAPPCCYH